MTLPATEIALAVGLGVFVGNLFALVLGQWLSLKLNKKAWADYNAAQKAG